MDKKLSDEQIDRIAKNLLNDFALDDKTLDEIAESPKLWWNVRNQIEAEKSRREVKRWFSAFRWQIPVFGALGLVFCLGLAGLLWNSKNGLNGTIADKTSVQNSNSEISKTPGDSTTARSDDDSGKNEAPKKMTNSAPEKVSVVNTKHKARFAAQTQSVGISAKQAIKSSNKKVLSETVTEETKTDFIALTYGAATDSGQIVRVKVPSSMMVSLGLTTNVEKDSQLVNAEVIVGDDGLARAIRFIR